MQPVGAAGVQRVRVAQHATSPAPVVRIAIDLDKPMPYHLEPTAQGALLRLGGAPALVAEAPAAPETVAAVAPSGASRAPRPRRPLRRSPR